MQFADPNMTPTDWLDENRDRDEATKLAALREYIFELAENWVGRDNMTTEWMNKKLTRLGIAEQIQREVAYTLRAPVTGEIDIVVYGTSRVEALAKATERLNGDGSAMTRKLQINGTPQFVDGPEDVDPATMAAEAPQTVADTLAKLREIILLAHISGPKICEAGANKVLAAYGQDPIPARKQFTVSRPVEAEMRTVVTAYDEESASRVAGWRWDNDRSGYQVVNPEPTDAASVTAS